MLLIDALSASRRGIGIEHVDAHVFCRSSLIRGDISGSKVSMYETDGAFWTASTSSNMDNAVIFSHHAKVRMRERGATEEQVLEAISQGDREPAKHGRVLYRLNREFHQVWNGRFYRIQQVAPVVVHEPDRIVVVSVYTFYFEEKSP